VIVQFSNCSLWPELILAILFFSIRFRRLVFFKLHYFAIIILFFHASASLWHLVGMQESGWIERYLNDQNSMILHYHYSLYWAIS